MILLVPALLLSVQPASAQSLISGDIAGTITDTSGAAIVGATVTVTNTGTGAGKTATTGAAGDYRVSLLQPGTYAVVVSAQGFQKASMSATVSPGTVSQTDAKLTVGSASQTIEVTGSAPVLHTEDAQVTTTFSMEQVQNLPNPGNDLTFVAQTAPGSVMNTQGGYGNFSAFGLPATSNTFTVNGGYENDPYLNVNNSGATNLLLGNNDVADVTVVSNAYDAAFGGLGGDQINETTRSGSNHFHGDASYWWNGRAMNANDFFNNETDTPKPFNNVNQWAGAVGGPIIKDKTFFFFNTEGLRVLLPTRGAIYAPTTDYETATLANLAANGLSSEIPLYNNIFSLFNNAAGRANAVPSPTSAAAPYSTVLFNGTANNLTHEWLLMARVDQNISDKDHMFVHFEYDDGLQATFTSLLNPVFDADSPQPQWSGQLNETHTFSPNVVNQFILSDIYYRAIFANQNMANAVAQVPMSLIFADGDLGSNGTSAWPGGLDIIWPQGRVVEGYQGEDDLSWTHNKHAIKVGWTMRRDDVTDWSPQEYTQSPEAVVFNTPGDALSFQNGYVDEWFQQFPTRPTQPVALYVQGAYVQDEWKATPGLTVTYGMRFEHNSNPVCQDNCFARLPGWFGSASSSATTPYNQIILSGRHRAFTGFQHVGYEPRIGFAYLPFGPGSKTTIRTGFGMFADAFPGQIAADFLNNAPTNVPFTIVGASIGGPALYPLDPTTSGSAEQTAAGSNKAFQAGYAGGATLTSLSAIPGFSPPSITTSSPHVSYPTYEEWSLAVEQEVAKATVVSVSYVGNRTYHQPVQDQSVNAYGFGSLPASIPNQNFGASTEIYSGGISNYNGGVASVTRRGHYINLQANYMYQHALDDVSNGGFDGFSGNSVFQGNPGNLAQQYGNSDYDTRQYFSASYVLMVPHWGGPKVLTDGWMLSGTVFHSAGLPFSVTSDSVASGIPNYGANPGGRLYAAQIAPLKSNHCGGEAHTIYAATATPCSFVNDFADATDFGQGRRNSVYGPDYTDTDLSVQKSFGMPHWESGKLDLGVQFFNLFNHVNFGQPGGNIDSGAFGLISTDVNTPTSILGAFLGGAADPRLIQLKAKFQF